VSPIRDKFSRGCFRQLPGVKEHGVGVAKLVALDGFAVDGFAFPARDFKLVHGLSLFQSCAAYSAAAQGFFGGRWWIFRHVAPEPSCWRRMPAPPACEDGGGVVYDPGPKRWAAFHAARRINPQQLLQFCVCVHGDAVLFGLFKKSTGRFYFNILDGSKLMLDSWVSINPAGVTHNRVPHANISLRRFMRHRQRHIPSQTRAAVSYQQLVADKAHRLWGLRRKDKARTDAEYQTPTPPLPNWAMNWLTARHKRKFEPCLNPAHPSHH
jgi:hypothetical protein